MPGDRKNASSCPCGSSKQLADCCGPIIEGATQAMTAQALMRSRYTAFTTGDRNYLLTSWHPASRPDSLELDPAQHWLSLKIIACQAGGPQDTEGVVEFVARFKSGGRAERLHEVSRFRRVDGQWRYLDGVVGQQ